MTTFVPCDDGSLPGTVEEQKALLEEWTVYNLDRYYKYVADVTYPCVFVPIEDAGEFLRFLSGKVTSIPRLHDLLENAINGRASFVKLCTRSPKDAMDKQPRFKSILKKHCKRMLGRCGAMDASANDTLQMLREAFGEAMSVNNAEDAMQLLVDSNRILSDVIRWKKLIGSGGLSLVVRPYEAIPLNCEFRCFVHRRNLVVISQYFDNLFFDNLPTADLLIESVSAFLEQLKRNLPAEYLSFIMDVSMNAEGRCTLIELNPYGPLTGAALFDFKEDESILYGDGPVQVRTNSGPKPIALTGAWKEMVQEALRELDANVAGDFASSSQII